MQASQVVTVLASRAVRAAVAGLARLPQAAQVVATVDGEVGWVVAMASHLRRYSRLRDAFASDLTQQVQEFEHEGEQDQGQTDDAEQVQRRQVQIVDPDRRTSPRVACSACARSCSG